MRLVTLGTTIQCTVLRNKLTLDIAHKLLVYTNTKYKTEITTFSKYYLDLGLVIAVPNLFVMFVGTNSFIMYLGLKLIRIEGRTSRKSDITNLYIQN